MFAENAIQQKNNVIPVPSGAVSDTAKLDYQLKTISEKSGNVVDRLSLLEQLAVDASQRCKNPKAPVLFGEHKTENRAVIFKAKCKQWSCKACGSRNARRALATLLNHINTVGKDKQWYILTLTAHEKWRTEEASHKNLQSGWDKLRKRMVRAYGKFEYFRTWEHHDDSAFHMHFIIDVEMPYTTEIPDDGEKPIYRCNWLKDNARQCGMGYMTDYQPLDNAGFGAHYACKYLVKSIEDDHLWLDGMHRYQTSHGWASLPDLTETTDFEWTYMHDETELWFKCYEAKDRGLQLYGVRGEKMMPHQVMQWYQEVRKLPKNHMSVIGVQPRERKRYKPAVKFYEQRTVKRLYLKSEVEPVIVQPVPPQMTQLRL